MRRFIIAVVAVLAGTHVSSTVMAQGYYPYYERQGPRFSRPYEYDRPYRGPYGDPGIVYPEEREFEQSQQRFREDQRRYEDLRRGPWRPY